MLYVQDLTVDELAQVIQDLTTYIHPMSIEEATVFAEFFDNYFDEMSDVGMENIIINSVTFTVDDYIEEIADREKFKDVPKEDSYFSKYNKPIGKLTKKEKEEIIDRYNFDHGTLTYSFEDDIVIEIG